MDNEQLIEWVTREVLQRLGKKQLEGCVAAKKALAIFTGGTIGLSEGLEEISKLKQSGFYITVVLSPAAEKITGYERMKEYLGMDVPVIMVNDEYPGGHLKEADVVLIPVLTENTAAKVANTMADSLASTLIMQALMRGKPVLAAKNAADPKDALRIQADMGHAAPGLVQALQTNLKKLEGYGVTLVSVQNLAAECQRMLTPKKSDVSGRTSEKKGIIDAQAIKAAADSGVANLVIASGTIITPLARDLAKDFHITIQTG